MSKEMMAIIAFGAICAFALIMFMVERRAAARRLRARGGREVDVASLIFLGAAAGKGEITHR